MIGWLARGVLLLAGMIAGWFVPHDDAGFAPVQLAVILLGFALVALVALSLPRAMRRRRG